jgi:hypothetical protein
MPTVTDVVGLVAQGLRGGKHRVSIGPRGEGGAVFDQDGNPVGLFKVEGEMLYLSLDIDGEVEHYKLGLNGHVNKHGG